jgi:hypothetical protein
MEGEREQKERKPMGSRNRNMLQMRVIVIVSDGNPVGVRLSGCWKTAGKSGLKRRV